MLFLKEVLDAGPYVESVKYDPFAAEAKKDGDVALEHVGKDAAMPWETDGVTWHTKTRLSHGGKPCRWEGDILTWIDERIHELGDFPDTSWKQPTVVEIAGKQKSLGWFFHAHTGMGLVGQVFALFVLTVAAGEAAIGLAIVVVYFRNRGSIAVDDVSMMKG